MADSTGSQDCAKRCWRMANIGGVVVFLVLWLLLGTWWLIALLLGAIVGLAGGPLLQRYSCPEGADEEYDITPAATAVADAPIAEAEAAAEATHAAASEATAETPLIKPSTPLPGQAELAGRKGTWRYEPRS